ncbi:MAG: 50S ribosomal protein L10 [Planctomycetes bacterium]|nr:50S ribosomal protein L10 [Planctomycetota bacterium]MBI3834473.1 50S ribosomal protein L10 [Planctomycetota bacterium]
MSKFVKGLLTEDLKKDFAGVASACVVELSGLDVKQQEKLRQDLRAKSGRLRVIKNSLARRAFEGGPLAPLGKAMVGPCALVTTEQSVVDVARMLVEAAKVFKKLKLKNAIFEGDASLLTVEQLSKMKGKLELLGEVAMLIASPGRRLAGCIGSPGGKIAGCLKTLADKAA